MFKKIVINGLYGSFNYEFELNKKITIIIGPNGSGKTTCFNIIDAALNSNTNYLLSVEFSSVILTKKNGDHITISKDNIEDENIEKKKVLIYYLDGTKYIIEDIKVGLMHFDRYVPQLIRKASDVIIDRETNRIFRTEDIYELVDLFSDYLPEDLLSVPDEVRNFFDGCQVSKIFTDRLYSNSKYYENNYRVNTVNNPSNRNDAILNCSEKLSQRILKETSTYATKAQSLDQAFPKEVVDILNLSEKDDYKIDRDRIKKNSEKLDELRVKLSETSVLLLEDDLLSSSIDNNFNSMTTPTLAVLDKYYSTTLKKLDNLIQLSEQIELLLNLFNKKILYSKKICSIDNEDGIQILNTVTNKKIPLSKLSSGEQHEFIQLYSLIFETNNGDILLIDEPEISIHVTWQRQYIDDLTDILKDKNVQVLLATHSVQILNGNWDSVIDLGEVE